MNTYAGAEISRSSTQRRIHARPWQTNLRLRYRQHCDGHAHASHPLLRRAYQSASAMRCVAYDFLCVCLVEREQCEFVAAHQKLISSVQKDFLLIVILDSVPPDASDPRLVAIWTTSVLVLSAQGGLAQAIRNDSPVLTATARRMQFQSMESSQHQDCMANAVRIHETAARNDPYGFARVKQTSCRRTSDKWGFSVFSRQLNPWQLERIRNHIEPSLQ